MMKCQGCGIVIAPRYIGEGVYQVGNYQICTWCLKKLRKRGSLQVEPYKQCLYLHPDGTVEKKRDTGGRE